MNEHTQLPSRPSGFVVTLTEQSCPGVYIVVTASRSLYVVEIISPDLPPQVTRYPVERPLLRDETPLPGVRGFLFDVETGVGQISWWKDNPGDYDRTDEPYVGTLRTTNTVVLIARIADRTPLTGTGFPADIGWDDVVAAVHATVSSGREGDEEPA